jgi:predicted transcriptional regulator of viral defense system
MNKKRKNMKTLGPQAAHLVTTLYEKSTPIFRLREVKEILCLDIVSSRSFIRKLVNRGIVTRLKPGLFILVPFELGKETNYMGNPFIVAREIMDGKDYFLSYATALGIHGAVTQPQLIVYITTLKPRRTINALGTEFKFIYNQKKYFFGIEDHWITKQDKIKVSNFEKTIIDGLKQPEYCGGLTEVAKGLWMRQQDINIKRLISYALKIEVGAVIRRLGYLLEFYNIGSPDDWDILKSHLTETYVQLDPLLTSEGKYLRKWRIQRNISPEELKSVVST